MIVCFLHISDADALLNLLRQRGFYALQKQIEQQIVLERILPHDALPVLSVRYGDESRGQDVFVDALANAMWEGMKQGERAYTTQLRERAPLFADQVHHNPADQEQARGWRA